MNIGKKINSLFYIIYVIIYLYVVKKYGMGSENSSIRYYALVFIILFGFLTVMLFTLKRKKIGKDFNEFKEKKLLISLIIAIMFYIFSYFKAKSVLTPMNSRTLIQIFLFLLPTIYAFIAINLFSKEEIIRLLKITTIAIIITYFTEEKHSLIQFLNISNWMKINLLKSNSFTESHICARCFTILFLFFNYVYQTTKEKSLIKYLITTFVFTVLCFKRMDILVAIISFLFSSHFSFKKRVSIKIILITSILLTISTIIYLSFLRGNIFTNLDAYTLTSGRNRILNLWAILKYYSYGFGTSMLVIGRYLEMDLIQIYLEMNIFALFSFVFSHLFFSKNNIYSFFIMLYVLLNMLFASSLANTLSWVILMITVAFISNDTIISQKE